MTSRNQKTCPRRLASPASPRDPVAQPSDLPLPFSSQPAGVPITDLQPAARDNDDRIEESRRATVSRDGPQTGPNQFQFFEKSTLKQRITQQNFLQNGAKIHMSHS